MTERESERERAREREREMSVFQGGKEFDAIFGG
jgi:hypothetical protein